MTWTIAAACRRVRSIRRGVMWGVGIRCKADAVAVWTETSGGEDKFITCTWISVGGIPLGGNAAAAANG